MTTRNATYHELSDELLMKEIVDGKEAAFSVLYDRYSKPMLNYFYKMLWQDREKAEDFMQELFTKIIHKPHLFNLNKSFKTWIFTIASNMCKNEYRKQEVRSNTSNSLHDNMSVVNEGDKTDAAYDRNSFKSRLKDELALLSENHRHTFILRFKHNLSIREVAEILETSEGTIKSRIFYTLKKLSENLKEFNPSGLVVLYVIFNMLYQYLSWKN